MQRYKLLFLMLCSLLCYLGTGCKKFLDVTAQTSSINPTTIKDFQEMLNSDSLGRCQYFLLDVMSDDIQLTDNQRTAASTYYTRAYLYESMVWNAAENDFIYNTTYTRILQANIILDRINDAPADELNTIQNRSNVISQALIHRAFFYLQLVNMYGPAYDSATAATDLGVPLSLVPDSYALLPRSSVEAVYNQVISDLQQAVDNPYLPTKGSDVIHPGKAAGFALLARAYLYKGDYTNAEKYADSTLARVSTLQNYLSTSYVAPTQLLDLRNNPEILMGKITADINFYGYYASSFRPSPELTNTFVATDARFTKRFSYSSYTLSTAISRAYVFDNSIGIAETMLIKAECLARKGDVLAAGNMLNSLRATRISTLDSRTYTTQNILSYVFSERRRELFCHGGLRLFDLKRLNKMTGYQVNIERRSVTGNTLLKTIASNSPSYLLPFSSLVLAANPNIVQNPR
ncbi:RagB/SusD family nutrient uptake outer membrane protein [Pedobacter sp. AW1-32]|uniref:RagB/SusD family nutrient uptake outer membrane protein n=1 Tax=Pedobacter sp. AW1-32 TaxID=3383026 RepID=UPI003FEF390A